jgi:hypothetical protein
MIAPPAKRSWLARFGSDKPQLGMSASFNRAPRAALAVAGRARS